MTEPTSQEKLLTLSQEKLLTLQKMGLMPRDDRDCLVKCTYKVEETELHPYGCSYDANKEYGNSPIPQCGYPVTLLKVQQCSRKHKIISCSKCGGKGYIDLKSSEKP